MCVMRLGLPLRKVTHRVAVRFEHRVTRNTVVNFFGLVLVPRVIEIRTPVPNIGASALAVEMAIRAKQFEPAVSRQKIGSDLGLGIAAAPLCKGNNSFDRFYKPRIVLA